MNEREFLRRLKPHANTLQRILDRHDFDEFCRMTGARPRRACNGSAVPQWAAIAGRLISYQMTRGDWRAAKQTIAREQANQADKLRPDYWQRQPLADLPTIELDTANAFSEAGIDNARELLAEFPTQADAIGAMMRHISARRIKLTAKGLAKVKIDWPAGRSQTTTTTAGGRANAPAK
jgi:hypothetical protein